jgi:hypothetical protein
MTNDKSTGTEIVIAWFGYSKALTKLLKSQLQEPAGLILTRATPKTVVNSIAKRFDNEGDSSDDYDKEEEEGDEIESGNIRELTEEDRRGDGSQNCDHNGARDCGGRSEVPGKTYTRVCDYGNTSYPSGVLSILV